VFKLLDGPNYYSHYGTLKMNSTEVQNRRRTLDDKCLCFSYAYHMCLVLFLSVQSLLMCFRSFHTRFADFVSKYI